MEKTGLYWINKKGEHIEGANPKMYNAGNFSEYSEIYGVCKREKALFGDCTGLRGDCSGVWGDCTGLHGDCSRMYGEICGAFTKIA